MTYSSRKPYSRLDQSSTKFFRDRVRHLKDTVGPESVYEKPYVTEEYPDMHQSPNVPTVAPPVGGSGGLVCLFSGNDCDIYAECFAGPDLPVYGGPQETDAGYKIPEIIQGGLVRYEIDDRLISLVLDPSMARNIILVTFVDGWGNETTETIDVTCTPVFTPYTVLFLQNINDGDPTGAYAEDPTAAANWTMVDVDGVNPNELDNNQYYGIWVQDLGLFVGVAHTVSFPNRLEGAITSPDGVEWTMHTTDVSQTNYGRWQAVVWAPEISTLCAVSNASDINRPISMTSSDGEFWTRNYTADAEPLYDVAWSPALEIFVAVGYGGSGPASITAISEDGDNWTITDHDPTMDEFFKSVIWCADLDIFVATVGATGGGAGKDTIYTSTDGETWTDRSPPSSTNGWDSIAWSPKLELFVATQYSSGDNYVTSPDGTTWTTRTGPGSVYTKRVVYWSAARQQFIMGGYYSNYSYVCFSSDGLTWTTPVKVGTDDFTYGVYSIMELIQ